MRSALHRNNSKPKRTYHRRASIYALVMGSSTLLTVIGLSALAATRIERRASLATADFAEARFYAQSAIELGLHMINSNADWRTTWPNGTWKNNQPLGNGTYTLQIVDPADNDLTDSSNEPVVITGIGVKGEARHQMRVTLESKQKGPDCLKNAMHIAGQTTLSSATVLQNNETISTNSNCNATSANVEVNVQAVGQITGGTYTGNRTSGITPLAMPDANAMNWYISNGTTIPAGSIPKVSGITTMEKVVFGPGVAPYGITPNANGIYILDCLSQQIRVRNFRVLGTLVFLNSTTNCTFENSVCFERATNNYPSLLVQGGLTLKYTNNPLSESSMNVNFNPPGAPSGGNTDDDKSDTYPSRINGMIYVTGSIQLGDYVTINGVLVGGATLSTTAGATLNLTQDGTFYNNPPPGFQNAPVLSLLPGSWQQSTQ